MVSSISDMLLVVNAHRVTSWSTGGTPSLSWCITAHQWWPFPGGHVTRRPTSGGWLFVGGNGRSAHTRRHSTSAFQHLSGDARGRLIGV